jgi:hypothetical protein
MEAKLTRLTHNIDTMHLVTAVSFAVLAPGGQSGNFWIHPRMILSHMAHVTVVL